MNRIDSGALVSDRLFIFAVALVNLFLHLIFINEYGIFNDEVYYLACGEHLDWGYVDQPPLVALIARGTTDMLGEALWAVRLPAVMAGSITVFLSGLIAFELGAGKFGAAVASLATMLAPFNLYIFHILSMNAFDVLFWTLLIYLLIKIDKSDLPNLWILFGAILGIALMNKYSAGLLVFFLFIGMLFSRMRLYFAEKTLWAGLLIAFLIFLPHILWQVQNGMPTLEFIENAKTQKMVKFGTVDYFIEQALIAQPIFYLLILAGTIYTIAARKMRRYSAVPIAYVLLLTFFIISGGKPYYIAAIFPAMFAFGALALGRLIYRLRMLWLRALSIVVIIFAGIATMPMGLPALPPEQFIEYQKTLGIELAAAEKNQTTALHQPYAGMFGWREMAETVSRVYKQLPAEEKPHSVVYGSTYAVAGAMDYYAGEFDLPPAVSRHNSYWMWGLPDIRIDVMIVVGGRKEELAKIFESCEKAAFHQARWAMPYLNNLTIWVCRRPKLDLREYWKKNPKFI